MCLGFVWVYLITPLGSRIELMEMKIQKGKGRILSKKKRGVEKSET
jgi:hypothetical protein